MSFLNWIMAKILIDFSAFDIFKINSCFHKVCSKDLKTFPFLSKGSNVYGLSTGTREFYRQNRSGEMVLRSYFDEIFIWKIHIRENRIFSLGSIYNMLVLSKLVVLKPFFPLQHFYQIASIVFPSNIAWFMDGPLWERNLCP